MNNAPIEVVIREAKHSPSAWVRKLLEGAIYLALSGLIVMWVVPPVMSVFGVEAHPNYGVSILIMLLANALFKRPGISYYGTCDTNEYNTVGK